MNHNLQSEFMVKVVSYIFFQLFFKFIVLNSQTLVRFAGLLLLVYELDAK